MLDSTSNPYLFAATVLLAGLSGLSENIDLAWEDCHSFPHSLTETERIKYGLDSTMPNSLQGALDSLKTDLTMKAWIPQALLDSYIPVKEKEVEVFQKMTEDQRRLRFLEYF